MGTTGLEPLVLSETEWRMLENWAKRPKTAQGRARVVLACAEGRSNVAVAARLGVSRTGLRSGSPSPRSLSSALNENTRQDMTATLTGHTSDVLGVAFSPDGLLATASADHTVRLWDPATGHCLHTLERTDYVADVAFSPDGHLLATSYLHTARLSD